MMLKHGVGVVALGLAVTSYAQSPAQGELRRELDAMRSGTPVSVGQEHVAERLEAHRERRELSVGQTAWLRARFLRRSENKLSSFLPEDRRVLDLIAELDRHAIERRAIEPLLLELCSGAHRDSFELGRRMDDIERKQAAAFETAVGKLLERLSLDGIQRINELGDGGTTRVVNWAGVANELPDVIEGVVQTACFKYRVKIETERFTGENR